MKESRKSFGAVALILSIVLSVGVIFGGFVGCDLLEDLGGSQSGTQSGSQNNIPNNTPTTSDTVSVGSGKMDIHFIELGNKYTGDCTYIKAGDNDILIDAGSRAASVPTITAYLDKYVTDGTLEYVIVTHAHQDHYAGFATNEKTDSLFDLYECEVIIDFSQITSGKDDQTMYKNYIRERDAEIEAGALHYTAKECIDQEKSVFDLGDGMSFEVLDSTYYHKRSSSENNHSVCTMFKDGDRNFLFTGDLEKEGEEELVKLNDLPEVDVYKAGHHGSKTSSNEVLLSVIKPDIICVCCCCGSPEYTDANENQFPTQKFIDRVAPYTDAIYVTTLCIDYAENKFTSMNGDIIIKSMAESIVVECSNNSTKLKDTEWFGENRTMPDAWK